MATPKAPSTTVDPGTGLNFALVPYRPAGHARGTA
jgi:hypothetical protein